MTFSDVYDEWTKRKFPTISESNVKGYTASYKTCESLYNKVFKDIKLVDLQTVIDTCGKNYPTLRKIKVLFNQLYDYALKNDICNKDYSSYVDVVQYKDRNLAHVVLVHYICRRIYVCECKHSHSIFTSKCTACRNV